MAVDSLTGFVLQDRYEFLEQIGPGVYSTVYVANDRKAEKESESRKAIKVIPSVELSQNVDTEAKILLENQHPNVVKVFDGVHIEDKFYVIMEYCDENDLEQVIERQRQKGSLFPEDTVIKWLVQLLQGVEFIHERGIIHRDIKPRNILVHRGDMKLGDFGVSRVLMEPADEAVTIVGTAPYMSPEMINSEGYNHKYDIWSIGCVLYEMVAQKRAFDGRNTIEIFSKIVNMELPKWPSGYSEELYNILKSTLTKDPVERPTASKLLNTTALCQRLYPGRTRAGESVKFRDHDQGQEELQSGLPGILEQALRTRGADLNQDDDDDDDDDDDMWDDDDDDDDDNDEEYIAPPTPTRRAPRIAQPGNPFRPKSIAPPPLPTPPPPPPVVGIGIGAPPPPPPPPGAGIGIPVTFQSRFHIGAGSVTPPPPPPPRMPPSTAKSYSSFRQPRPQMAVYKQKPIRERTVLQAQSNVAPSDEYVVNFLVRQKTSDFNAIYIDCCKKSITETRLKELETLRYTKGPVKSKDIVLKDNCLVLVTTSGPFELDMDGTGKKHCELLFDSRLDNAGEEGWLTHCKDAGSEPSKCRGFVNFSVERSNISSTEKRRAHRRVSGAEGHILLCALPLMKTSSESQQHVEVAQVKSIPLQGASNRPYWNPIVSVVEALKGEEWVALAKELHYDSANIGQFRQKSQDNDVVACMLLDWFRRTRKKSDKMDTLSKALQTIGHKDVAELLIQKELSAKEDRFFRRVADDLVEDARLLHEQGQFLRLLGLSDADILELQSTVSTRSLKETLRQGVMLWRSREGSTATVKQIVDCLVELKHLRLAEIISERHVGISL